MKWKEVLSEEDGIFSWRKAMTAIAALLFLASCTIFWFGGKELPDSYIMIISGVFASYFFRHRMSGQSSTFVRPSINSGYTNNNGNGNEDVNGNGNEMRNGNDAKASKQPQNVGDADISGA